MTPFECPKNANGTPNERQKNANVTPNEGQKNANVMSMDAQNYEDSNFFCIYRWEGVKKFFFTDTGGVRGAKSSIYQNFLSSDWIPLRRRVMEEVKLCRV